ncbi:MAG: T9SS C-terminal target domain-containing protein, partial [Balneolaceae bacterium]
TSTTGTTATSTTGTTATSTTGISATSPVASPFFAPVSAPALASAPSLAPSVTAQGLNASVLITDVPFVNQVWDTPFFSGNNYNYAACAPATAAMAIGYFRKVPPWPSSRHQGITRNYANYVGLEYTAYGFTFNTVSRGVKGGMGYMWSSQYGASGSPRTTMAGYINRHDLESVQVWSLPYADMVKELEDGNPYPLCVMLTSAGHLILALGVQEGRRTVIVHDPYGNKNIAYPSYQGKNVVYDWPGYNYGNQNLVSVAWAVSARGIMPAVEYHIPKGDHDAGFASLSEALDWVNVQEELENSIRFVITDDLDERGNDLQVSYPFSMQTPLSIVAADGSEPVITLDRPFVIGAPYVTVDGNNGLDEPGLTIHYTGDLLHYHDFGDGAGPVEMPVVAVQAGAERVALKHLHLTRDEAVSDIPMAVQLGLGAETDVAPGHLTLENTRIGTESASFYAGLFVDGVASASQLEITDNIVHASHSALLFSRPVFDAEVSRNRFFVSADADGDFDGGVGPASAATQDGGGAQPASIRTHPEFAAASLQGSGLQVRDNRIVIRESGAGNVTVDGVRLFGLSGDNLLANNMINVIPLEAASDGSRTAGIAVHTAGEDPGADDDAAMRLYHNTVRIHGLVHTPATASLRVTGTAGDRQFHIDVRNNLWINEHQPLLKKTAFAGAGAGSGSMGSAGSAVVGSDVTGNGQECDEAGTLGLCLDTDAGWSARANNWFTTVDALSGWINGQTADGAEQMELLTGDDRTETVPVHFSGDTELLLDDLSRGDVALTGRGVADVPADILGNPRHPVFPYMGAHEPEPTLAPTLSGDYHIPQGDHDKGYDSLGEAFADLNANGAEGPFRFLIHQDLDETGAQLYLNREDLSAGTRMTLEPAGSDVTIRIAHPVLIENTSHVTIAGGEDRGLRFKMEEADAGQAIWIVGSSRHVALRNLGIVHEFGPHSNTIGVQVRRDDAATVAPEYITLEGLQIGSLEHPFRDGVRLWGTNDPMLRVRAHVTGSHIVASHRGITTFFTESNTYQGNLIEITGHYANPSWYAGIYLAGTRGTTVRANQIRMLGINASSARYAAGVNINQNEGSISLINNMISVTDDFVNRGSSSASRVYGVGIHREGQGERYNFLHNTIYLGATGQTGHSAVIGWENVTPDEEPANYFIINNLMTNRHDRMNAFGWRWHVGNLRSVHSNNIDVSGRALVGWYEGQDAPEMSRWCELSDVDHNSRTAGVYYRSDRDLRLAEESEGDNLLAGTYLPSVSTDIFGNPRNTDAPYKGAWESLEAVLTGESDRQELSDIPDAFRLQQNYPNPFNAQTSIAFDLPVDSKVRLEVYNVVGQRIVTLVDGMQPAGSHTVSFDASQLASGVYVYRIQAGSFVKTHKMTLVK